MHKSIDGGKTFSAMRVPHGDNHDMWIDPDDPGRFIVGNDGGATITYNGGKSWSTLYNQPTAQFYRVTTDNQFPYWVYGSQQDNSNVSIPSGVPGDAIGRSDWHSAGGGESGWMAVDPTDPNIVYAGEYGGIITRYDHRTRQARIVMAWPQLADGHATLGPEVPVPVERADHDLAERPEGALPRFADPPAQPRRRRDLGGDLARPDAQRQVDKQGKSGGPITIDVTGVELYGTIFALGESTADPGVIWAGSDDGLVHVTRDDGKTWQNVTPKGMPEWIQINAIDASPRDKGTAYVAATMYKWDDFRPYLYKTSDYGKTWTKIVNGIPDGAFTRVVREDPVRQGLLYAGTELGLYVSFDDGASWQPFQRNLPPRADHRPRRQERRPRRRDAGARLLDPRRPDGRCGSGATPCRRPAVTLFPPRSTVRLDLDPRDEEDEPQTAGHRTSRPASSWTTGSRKRRRKARR